MDTLGLVIGWILLLGMLVAIAAEVWRRASGPTGEDCSIVGPEDPTNVETVDWDDPKRWPWEDQ